MCNYTILEEITSLDGVAGNEHEIKHYMAQKFLELGVAPEYDEKGSVIGQITGDLTGPIIMANGRMDEQGFYVNKITKDGFIEAVPIENFKSIAKDVVITTKDGSKIEGTICDTNGNTIYIDVGARNDSEIKEMGIKKLDMITSSTKFKILGMDRKHLLSKAFDCRIGCAIVLETMKNLNEMKYPNTFAGVGMAKEEISQAGAGTASYYVGPQIEFAFDIVLADDIPKGEKKICLEKGPVISVDLKNSFNKALYDFVTNVSKIEKIPYQTLETNGTSKNDIPSISICIPARYVESNVSMIHYDDYKNAVKLITEIVKLLDRNKVREILEN